MAYEWLEAHCLQKPGAVKHYQEEWGCVLYRVGDKMFLMDGGDKNGAPIISLKLTPPHGELVRNQYPGAVVSGYYMNKTHWSSVYYSGDVPDEQLKAWIDESYDLIFGSLSKRQQAAILAE